MEEIMKLLGDIAIPMIKRYVIEVQESYDITAEDMIDAIVYVFKSILEKEVYSEIN